MGLSSKQVSRDGVGWNQALLQAQTMELPKPLSMKRQQPTNQQQQAEPLKCPRCDSPNTKFCYYNNYNKSQPRHFCKTCKRHWTKGGTLRNVPVGGGRKNKRLKTSNTSANTAATTTKAAATTTTTSGSNINNNRVNNNTHVGIQCQQPIRQNLAFAFGDQKNLSDILYQAMIQHPPVPSSSNLDMKDLSTKNNGIFIGSSPLSLPQNQNQSLLFPYTRSTSFDTTPSSISTSIQSSNVYNYAGETIDDPTITSTFMPTTTSSTVIGTQPWQVSTTICSTGMDTTSYWNWDDIDTFASTDLNNWVDDSDHVKP